MIDEPDVPHGPSGEPLEAAFERVVEALVFVAEAPVSDGEIAEAYGEVTGLTPLESAVAEAVEALNATYERTGRPFRIERWGGGYRLATVPEVAPFVRALLREERRLRLSRSLMETLSVVAYKQPVTKPEIDHVRGVDADHALRRLLELDFVEVAGRADSIGRPLLYATTPAFLDAFGLADLDALPRPREVQELLADPAFQHQHARLLEGLAPTDPPADSPPDAVEPSA